MEDPGNWGQAVELAKHVAYAPSESPDGAYIYYVETYDKPSPLWRACLRRRSR